MPGLAAGRLPQGDGIHLSAEELIAVTKEVGSNGLIATFGCLMFTTAVAWKTGVTIHARAAAMASTWLPVSSPSPETE